MRKSLLVVLSVIVAALAVGVVAVVFRTGHNTRSPQSQSPVDNLDVMIDGQRFSLVDGVAQLPAAPGAATVNTLRVVGDPVSGDVSGDDKPDAALLLRNEPGGSGTFYYAVVAVHEGGEDDGTWHATNALALGDRISPEGIEYKDGRFVYRFLEHAPGEPMANAPRVEKLVPVRFDTTTQQISAGP